MGRNLFLTLVHTLVYGLLSIFVFLFTFRNLTHAELSSSRNTCVGSIGNVDNVRITRCCYHLRGKRLDGYHDIGTRPLALKAHRVLGTSLRLARRLLRYGISGLSFDALSINSLSIFGVLSSRHALAVRVNDLGILNYRWLVAHLHEHRLLGVEYDIGRQAYAYGFGRLNRVALGIGKRDVNSRQVGNLIEVRINRIFHLSPNHIRLDGSSLHLHAFIKCTFGRLNVHGYAIDFGTEALRRHGVDFDFDGFRRLFKLSRILRGCSVIISGSVIFRSGFVLNSIILGRSFDFRRNIALHRVDILDWGVVYDYSFILVCGLHHRIGTRNLGLECECVLVARARILVEQVGNRNVLEDLCVLVTVELSLCLCIQCACKQRLLDATDTVVRNLDLNLLLRTDFVATGVDK